MELNVNTYNVLKAYGKMTGNMQWMCEYVHVHACVPICDCSYGVDKPFPTRYESQLQVITSHKHRRTNTQREVHHTVEDESVQWW